MPTGHNKAVDLIITITLHHFHTLFLLLHTKTHSICNETKRNRVDFNLFDKSFLRLTRYKVYMKEIHSSINKTASFSIVYICFLLNLLNLTLIESLKFRIERYGRDYHTFLR